MTRRATTWVVAIVAVMATLAGVVVASGLRFYTVMTPSMGQTAPVGTLVATRPEPRYGVGEIVTYETHERSYTHRIITANSDGTFITKGDLNRAADPLPVQAKQIVGRAVWLGQGLGWLWQGLPWLTLGFLLVYLLSLIRRLDHTWRWVTRISGWTLVFCLVAVWLHPWVSLSQLSWVPSTPSGVDMHVVNTGLFPLDALGQRLVSGQDAVVHVTQQNDRGYYILTPGLAFHWWEQLGLFLLCLVPMALSFLIKDVDSPAPTRAIGDPDADAAGEGVPETAGPQQEDATVEQSVDEPADPSPGAPAQARWSSTRRLILVAAIVLSMVVAVAVVTFTTTSSALTAKVTNSTDTVGTRTYYNCLNAVSSTAQPRPYLAWGLDSTAHTTSYLIGLGATTQDDLSNNGRTGVYTSSTGRTRIFANTSSYACPEDATKAAVTFTGATGGYCLAQSIGAASTNPQSFSIEAWFKTGTKGSEQGKIIGFGNSRADAADGNYDRHIYLDRDGRIVFGVYPGAVKIVYSPAGKDYADDNWHHVVATMATSGTYRGMSLYVDGALVDTDTGVTAAQSYSGYWKVGCGKLTDWQNAATAESGNTGNYDFDGASYFTGQIEYASVYAAALTPAQVKEHYLAGAA